MKVPSKTAEKISQEVNDLMDRLGVSKFVAIVGDPDSDAVTILKRGDVCWIAGALTMQIHEQEKEWDLDY